MFPRNARLSARSWTGLIVAALFAPVIGGGASSATHGAGPGGIAFPGNRASVDLNGALLLSDGVFTPLPNVPGALSTVHLRMNNRGWIVGTYGTTPGDPARVSAFVMRRRAVTTIEVPGAFATVAVGVNDRGQVVGGYVEPDAVNPTGESPTRGYLWDNGVFTLIDVPGAPVTAPYEINNRGHIVGNYTDAGGVQHGFILRDGVYTTVDHPNATRAPNVTATRLVGINDAGRIVGSYGDDAGVLTAFVLDRDGEFSTIDLSPLSPAIVGAEASAVNNRGQVVGRYLAATPKLVSFLQGRRGLVGLDVPGRCDTAAFDINDRREILIAPTGTTDGSTCTDASSNSEGGR